MNQFLKLLLAATMIFCPNLALAQSAMKGGGLIEGVTSVVSSASTVTISAVWRPTYYVTTGTSSQLYVLPAATALPVGRYYIFKNESTGMVTIQANGGTVLRSLAPNERSEIRLTANGTAAGTWSVENNTAVNVAQATFFGGGSMAGATGCSFVETTSATETNFVALANTATGCGAWSGTNSNVTFSTNDYRPTLVNPGAGTYQIQVKGPIYSNSSNVCNFRLSDGTNTYEPQSSLGGGTGISDMFTPNLNWTVPVTAAGSKTLSIQASASGAATCGILTAASGRSLSWQIYYFPSQAQSVVRMDQTNYDWRSYTPTFTGFGTVSGVNCREKRDGADNVIDCTFTPGTSTAVEARMSLPGSNVSSSSLPTLSFAGYGVINVAGPGQFVVLKEPSVGYITFGIQYASGAGLAKQNGSAVLSSGQTYSFTARVPIQGWTENQSAPLVAGGVTSSSAGMERIERASVFCDATSSITSQSGSWLSSIGNITSNRCTLTIAAGLFSSKPTCTATVNSTSTTLLISPSINPTSATNVTIGCMFLSGGAAAPCGGSNQYDVICVGPR